MMDYEAFLATDDDLEKETCEWLLALLSSRRHLIICLMKDNAALQAEVEKLKNKQEQQENE